MPRTRNFNGRLQALQTRIDFLQRQIADCLTRMAEHAVVEVSKEQRGLVVEYYAHSGRAAAYLVTRSRLNGHAFGCRALDEVTSTFTRMMDEYGPGVLPPTRTYRAKNAVLERDTPRKTAGVASDNSRR